MTKRTRPHLADSQRRTSKLRDRIEITDLIYRLGACLDEHRFDDLNALLTEDATATTAGGTARGRTVVVAQAARTHADYDRLQHLITNVLVDLDGDHAAARANLVATFGRGAGRPEFLLGEVYRFRARRAGEGWRLSGVEVNPVWRLAPQ